MSVVPEQDATDAEHLQTLLAASQYAPVVKPWQDVVVPHLQAPETHVSPDILHAATVAEHLQTLLAASQYAPVDKSLQDEAVPHLQAPETQVSPDTLHASTVDEHLQIPLPLLAEASQNSPVEIPEHELRLDVHLQTLLPASQ